MYLKKKKIIKLTHFEKAKQLLYTFLSSHKAVRVAIFSSVHVIIQRNIFTEFMVIPVWEQQLSTILHTTCRPIFFDITLDSKTAKTHTCAENNLPWFVMWYDFYSTWCCFLHLLASACREKTKTKHKHPITNPGRSW